MDAAIERTRKRKHADLAELIFPPTIRGRYHHADQMFPNVFHLVTIRGESSVTLRGHGFEIRLVGCDDGVAEAYRQLESGFAALSDTWRIEAVLRALYYVAKTACNASAGTGPIAVNWHND